MNTVFLQPNWPAPSCVKAFTTLRASNISLKQTTITKGTPGNINRDLLKKTFNLPADPIWINQTHTNIAVKADRENDSKTADAVYTDKAHQVCAVLTADCLPVLICDKAGKHVAAVHAGWRGLASGVIEATLDKLALPADETLCWLGPAIGRTKFEVRRDVYDIFTAEDPEAKTGFKQISDEHWLGDMYHLTKIRLARRGIKNVYGGDFCTYSDQESFFSYRRDGQILGHIISLIWLDQ